MCLSFQYSSSRKGPGVKTICPFALFIFSFSILAFEFSVPDDFGYANIKDYGARGDGVSDDARAFEEVFGRSKEHREGSLRSIYIPNGTYLISRTIKWGDKKKDVRGESRKGVIIMLEDSCEGFGDASNPRPVFQVEYGHPAQNFCQTIRNLTVDIGAGNPGAIGIAFHTNNYGGIWNVAIRSSDPQKRGTVGLALHYNAPGPGIVSEVTVDGFDRGISVHHSMFSFTFEKISLLNQRIAGFENKGNTIALGRLTSQNSVPALINTGEPSLISLVDARLLGGNHQNTAVINDNNASMLMKNVFTEGYAATCSDCTGATIEIPDRVVPFFSSHGTISLFEHPQALVDLKVEDPPVLPLGPPEKWLNAAKLKPAKHVVADGSTVKDFGPSIQKAIDRGVEVIYFPPGNYPVYQTIHILNKLKGLFGAENAQLKCIVPGKPVFVIEDGTPEAVLLDINQSYNCRYLVWALHASKRTLIMGNGSYYNSVPGGKVFIEDAVSCPLIFDRQQVWIRQVNPEKYDYDPSITNRGGDLWVLGLKTEKDRPVIGTYDGGRTVMYGGAIYKNRQRVGPSEAFIIKNSAAVLSYRNYGLHYQAQVIESRDTTTRILLSEHMPASSSRMPLYNTGKLDGLHVPEPHVRRSGNILHITSVLYVPSDDSADVDVIMYFRNSDEKQYRSRSLKKYAPQRYESHIESKFTRKNVELYITAKEDGKVVATWPDKGHTQPFCVNVNKTIPSLESKPVFLKSNGLGILCTWKPVDDPRVFAYRIFRGETEEKARKNEAGMILSSAHHFGFENEKQPQKGEWFGVQIVGINGKGGEIVVFRYE
ncbi:MAG: hypothetical protein GF401_15590 [Chitinivibrionales bacterium]|nr:hypothetical protein [Chitinivibrionales bacterium]